MKVMKLALLGTAALAAVSVSARADELSDLKAQIEALQADVAALQAAPSVPAGYQLLSVSEANRIVVPGLEVRDSHGQSATATTIGVMPTADVPASTVIQWSGSVRAALTYTDVDYTAPGVDYVAPAVPNTDGGGVRPAAPPAPLVAINDYDNVHIKARGRLDVTGTTDTAVGEVGASMSLYGDFDGAGSAGVMMDYAWGWWKMTPELTFAGGYNGSLATIGYGIRKINDAYITRGATGVDGGDFTQFRISYASGPVGVAVALEHTDEGDNNLSGLADGQFGVAAEVTYAGDMFNAELAGYMRDADSNGTNAGGDVTQTQIGLGVGLKLSDMFDISAAASIGNNVWYHDGVSYTAFNATAYNRIGDGWEASIAAVATLSDSISAEIGFGMSDYEQDNVAGVTAPGYSTEVAALAGGIYWSPVSQLKMGVQASWTDVDNTNAAGNATDAEALNAAFVTWWNF